MRTTFNTPHSQKYHSTAPSKAFKAHSKVAISPAATFGRAGINDVFNDKDFQAIAEQIIKEKESYLKFYGIDASINEQSKIGQKIISLLRSDNTEGIVNALKAGEFKGIDFAIVSSDGLKAEPGSMIHTLLEKNPAFKKILKSSSEPTVLAFQTLSPSDRKAFDELLHTSGNNYDKLVKDSRLSTNFPLLNGNDEGVTEVAMGAILRPLITGQLLDNQDVPKQMASLLDLDTPPTMYNLVVGMQGGQEQFNTALQREITVVSRQLKASHVAANTYVEGVPFSEMAFSFMLGAVIGGGGEFLIHKFLEAGGSSGFGTLFARWLCQFGVDVTENTINEFGIASQDAQISKTKLLDWGALKQLDFKGFVGSSPEAARIGWRSFKAAAKGGLVGATLFGPVGAMAYNAKDDLPLEARAAMVAYATVGTSLSIYYNLLQVREHIELAVERMIDKGQISVPEGMERTRFIHDIASVDLASRLNFKASAKALPIAPIANAGLYTGTTLAMGAEAGNLASMTFGPPMENILRGLYMLTEVTHHHPERMKELRAAILEGKLTADKYDQIMTSGWGSNVINGLGGINKLMLKIPGLKKIAHQPLIPQINRKKLQWD